MRKKFAWFFCIFMSSLVLLSCSEDNKKGEEPGDGTGGGTPEGDTKTYNECPHVPKLAKFKPPRCPIGVYWNTLCLMRDVWTIKTYMI